jgi:hypothetical protein
MDILARANTGPSVFAFSNNARIELVAFIILSSIWLADIRRDSQAVTVRLVNDMNKDKSATQSDRFIEGSLASELNDKGSKPGKIRCVGGLDEHQGLGAFR